MLITYQDTEGTYFKVSKKSEPNIIFEYCSFYQSSTIRCIITNIYTYDGKISSYKLFLTTTSNKNILYLAFVGTSDNRKSITFVAAYNTDQNITTIQVFDTITNFDVN
jgi:hypothetical protein